MKRFLFFTIALFCALFYSSCKTTSYTYKPFSTVFDSWIGSTENEFVKQIGPPNSTTEDGNGGKILVYSETSYYTIGRVIPSYIKGLSPTYVNSLNSTNRYFNIYVDSNHKIYHYRTNYPDYPDKSYKRTSIGKTIGLGFLIVVIGIVIAAAATGQTLI